MFHPGRTAVGIQAQPFEMLHQIDGGRTYGLGHVKLRS